MRLLLLACIIFVSAGTCAAHASDLPAVNAYVQRQVKAHRFSGTVLVAVNDRVVFQRAYGYANVELHVANTLQTRFRIFSMTKQFIAAAIMTLAQQGKIDVTAPVSRYVEHWPAGWANVTIAEMLNHSSGIPQLENAWFEAFTSGAIPRSQCANYDAVIGKFANDSVLTAPGTTWRYNNFGYDVLGCVIERVSGRPLAAYMASDIFTPAAMAQSGLVGSVEHPEQFYNGPRVIDGLATGYNGTTGIFGSLQHAMPLQYGSAGAGDMYTTAGDLWRYSEALYHNSVLTAATQRLMLDDNVPTAGGLFGPSCAPACAPLKRVHTPNVWWGLGWRIEKVRSHLFMSHSGGNNGFSAEFARFPEEHATIVVLSNFGFTDVTALRAAIARIVFHGKYTTP
jgi:CubicO group peptidase (beta-lactamase class C family)